MRTIFSHYSFENYYESYFQLIIFEVFFLITLYLFWKFSSNNYTTLEKKRKIIILYIVRR